MSGPRDERRAPASSEVVRATLELDRQAAETLHLELRRLARRHGFDPDAIRVEIHPRPEASR